MPVFKLASGFHMKFQCLVIELVICKLSCWVWCCAYAYISLAFFSHFHFIFILRCVFFHSILLANQKCTLTKSNDLHRKRKNRNKQRNEKQQQQQQQNV